ncbi:PrsW family intramembrane metalloprotease [Candidatus Peribacteria bacterium]|nr:PrsW family intramembrane metalloprotease [Candidatus Peribacteria bacterium]
MDFSALTAASTAIAAILLNKTFLLCVGLSMLPIMAWVWYFNQNHPEKARYVLVTFTAGMLSIIPIKLYEQYWDIALWKFEHIDLFRAIADLVHLPSLDTLLAYVSLNTLVSLGFYCFSLVMMFLLEVVLLRDNSLKTFLHKAKVAFESPWIFASVGVLTGLLAYGVNSTLSHVAWLFIVVGMLEEYLKHLVLRFSGEDKICSVDDALQYAIFVALGFAFIENIMYLLDFATLNPIGTRMFWMFYLLRSSVSVLAHVSFSGILGYFYGIAQFSHRVMREASSTAHPFKCLLQRLLHCKKCTLYHEEKMMEGMLIAMGLHAVFNVLLEYNRLQYVIPMILLLFFVILQLYHRKDMYEREGLLTDFDEGEIKSGRQIILP